MTSHRKRHTQKVSLYLGIGVVVLILFMLIFGLDVVIRASLFFTQGSSSQNTLEQQSSEKDEDFYGVLDVNTVPSATNSAALQVSGSATNFRTVDIYVNDIKVEEADVDEDGSFSDEVGLDPGSNEVYLKAKGEKDSQRATSEVYQITYIANPPTLEVWEPQNESITNNQEITVRGKVSGDSSIRVNGSPVVVNAQGEFQKPLRLREGDNVISVLAEDEAGNEVAAEVKVKYEK